METTEEKKEFITTMCNNVRDEMLSKADKMPDYWDGKYLRLYIADKFSEVVWKSMSHPKRKYNNDVLVHCL
jgi:hypothetical protein